MSPLVFSLTQAGSLILMVLILAIVLVVVERKYKKSEDDADENRTLRIIGAINSGHEKILIAFRQNRGGQKGEPKNDSNPE